MMRLNEWAIWTLNTCGKINNYRDTRYGCSGKASEGFPNIPPSLTQAMGKA